MKITCITSETKEHTTMRWVCVYSFRQSGELRSQGSNLPPFIHYTMAPHEFWLIRCLSSETILCINQIITKACQLCGTFNIYETTYLSSIKIYLSAQFECLAQEVRGVDHLTPPLELRVCKRAEYLHALVFYASYPFI